MAIKKRKTAKRKVTRKKAPSVKVEQLAKIRLDFPLDEKKVAAIQRCLAKGKLTITATKVHLGTGRLGNGYLYD